MDNFQQTVDLREKMEKRKSPPPPKKKEVASDASADRLEEIFTAGAAQSSLKKISRPAFKEPREGLVKIAVFTLAILVVGATVYFLFFRSKSAAVDTQGQAWYAIKLVNGEIFFGQVADVKADPVIISNVYYNYDQAKEAAAGKKDLSRSVEETGNIRLVKRGQETHGPAGSMDVVRAQVLFMEPLKADSKVLKAILDYEK